MRIKRIIGIVYLLNGLSMFIVWPMLLIKDQAPEIETNFKYMCFHLSSEFITAIFCVITGIGLLFNNAWANKLYFLTTGLFIGAGYLAIGYYLFSDLTTGLPLLIMLSILNIIGLVIFITILKKGFLSQASDDAKLILFFSGMTFYTLINIAGFLSEMNSGYTYGYVSIVFVILIYTTWLIIANLKRLK